MRTLTLPAAGTVLLLSAGLGLATDLAQQPSKAEEPSKVPATPAAASPAGAPAADPTPLRVKKLAGGVHVLHGRGGNVGFWVGPDSVLVVDTQFKDVAPGILAEIAKVTDRPVRYLVNTHHHGDHVGGNASFVKLALALSHDNVRKRMLAAPAEAVKRLPGRIDEARKRGDEKAAAALAEQLEWARNVKLEEIPAPYLTFDSEFRLHLPGETVHVWHTPPAHTDGDAVVFFEKANVVHMGDLFFNKLVPVIDVSGGGTPKGYLDALDRVLARLPADVTIIPGHGEVADVAALKTFRQYIVDLTEAARKAKAAGKTKEAFAAEPLAGYEAWEGYARRYATNAQAAFDEVAPGGR